MKIARRELGRLLCSAGLPGAVRAASRTAGLRNREIECSLDIDGGEVAARVVNRRTGERVELRPYLTQHEPELLREGMPVRTEIAP